MYLHGVRVVSPGKSVRKKTTLIVFGWKSGTNRGSFAREKTELHDCDDSKENTSFFSFDDCASTTCRRLCLVVQRKVSF